MMRQGSAAKYRKLGVSSGFLPSVWELYLFLELPVVLTGLDALGGVFLGEAVCEDWYPPFFTVGPTCAALLTEFIFDEVPLFATLFLLGFRFVYVLIIFQELY